MRGHLTLVARCDAPRDGVSAELSIRAVLAEFHAGMRHSLRVILDREQGVEVVAEATSLASALNHVCRHRPHVLLIDPYLPDGTGIDSVRSLKDRTRSSEIVVLTMNESATFARHMLEAGAIGLVLKDAADTELVEAVRCAARGERYISPRVIARLAGAQRSITHGPLDQPEIEVRA